MAFETGTPRASSGAEELSILDLLGEIWRVRWRGLALIVALAGASGLASLLVSKQYQASVVVSPVADDNTSSRLGALGSMLSEVSGLGSSLGGIGGPGSSQKAEAVAILQSEAVTEDYIRSQGLLQVLYANIWDAAAGRWTVTDPRKQPTVWKANQYFKKKIRIVTTDTRTGLVTLSIKFRDPKAAARWANDLVRLANATVRNKAIAESERNIAYLTEQAQKTDVVGVKQAIYAILQSEINKVMIARGREEYALRIIDPATPPESAVSPSMVLWAVSGALGGLVLNLLLAFVRLARRGGALPAG